MLSSRNAYISSIVFCLVFIATQKCDAFAPSFTYNSISSTTYRNTIEDTVLSAKPRKGGPSGKAGGKATKKNKKRNSTSGNSKKSRKKGDDNKKGNRSEPVAQATGTKAPKTQQKNLPPWKVMSKKDVKKNIQSEIQRREAIRQGELSSSVTSLEEKVGDVDASSSLITPTDRQLLKWKRFRPDRDIDSMTFEGAYLGMRLPPSLGVPEIAFLGRSNVGKSSLLNRLSKSATNASNLDTATVGKTPGATASVNLYSLQSKNKGKNVLAFADLPGFGYAKLSKGVKEDVEMAAERYLGKRKELALGILLVDCRRDPSDDDRGVLAALYDMNLPILVVATKIDKMSSKNALENQLEKVRVGLGLPQGQPFCISSVTGEGVKQLWTIINDACEDKIEELREQMEQGDRKSMDDSAEAYGNIQLDEYGNFIEEESTDEGLEWIQSFAYYDDSKESVKPKQNLSDEALMKMKENEARQAAENEAQKVRNLKKVARKMQRKGEL